mgnify:CR=1 FL=1|tara:strand:+ start:73 stop:303 length:231 start_codon:yes stop_codon:yes gene_type:complete
MDLCLIPTKEGTYIRTASIHGMLWLQTHFEQEYWDAIATGEVKISPETTEELGSDAEEAGLRIHQFPLISSKISKF